MNIRQKLFVGFLVIASLVGVVGYYGIRTLGKIQQNSQLADLLDQFLVKSRVRDSILSKITSSAGVADFMELKQELRQLDVDADALSAQMLKLPRFKTIADMAKVVQKENEYDKIENTILQRHHELLIQQKGFVEAYPKEKALRYALRKPLFETKDPKLIQDFGSVQYFGKEALYQYEDEKHVHEWLQSINNVAHGIKTRQIGLSAKEKEDLLRQLAAYMEVAEIMGQFAIQKKNVRIEEIELTAESMEIGRVLEALRSSVSNEISREISDSFRNNRNFLIIIFAFTLLLAVGVSFFVYQSISIPIIRLKDAAEEIGKGNLDKRVDIESKDEIGVLASSFNQMVGYLQEATVSRDRLEKEIIERMRVEEQLRQANAELASHEKTLQETLSDLQDSHEQLKAAQSQLIQVEKLESVGKLAAGVAHEVKNPLTIMLQGIHYLSKHLPANGDNAAMALQDMNDAVKRADSVVRGLLNFSAPSELRLTTEELNSVVEQSLLLVRHELDRYCINAVRELSEHLPSVRVDRNKMEQVFVNIFLNAVHAMPEGGTLTVKTYTKQLTEVAHKVGFRKADDFRVGQTVVMAEVEDTGTGIPEDKLTKVFDPFFTTKATGKGTGLGLTVSRKIIDLHGGTINIGNRKGRGVRASIMFKAQGGNDHEEETDSAH